MGLGLLVLSAEVFTRCWYISKEKNKQAGITWDVHWPTNRWQFRESPLGEQVLQILKYNDGRSATWQETGGTEWMLSHLSWKPGRAAVSLARSHQPEICLPMRGHAVRNYFGVKTFDVQGKNFSFRAYEFLEKPPLFLFHSVWEEGGQPLEQELTDVSIHSRIKAVRQGRRMLGQNLLQIAIRGVLTFEEAEALVKERLPEFLQLRPATSGSLVRQLR